MKIKTESGYEYRCLDCDLFLFGGTGGCAVQLGRIPERCPSCARAHYLKYQRAYAARRRLLAKFG